MSFWGTFGAKAIIIFVISTLEYVRNEFLTHPLSFGLGSTFSKDQGSSFSEGSKPGLGPLYKECPCLFSNLT